MQQAVKKEDHMPDMVQEGANSNIWRIASLSYPAHSIANPQIILVRVVPLFADQEMR